MSSHVSPLPADWAGYGLAVMVVSLCTAVSWAIHSHLELSNIIMVYLLGVVGVSAWTSRGPSLLASVLSVLAFDFFFVPPYLSFTVLDSQYLITFAVMLVVALVISTLADRIRRQAEAARAAQVSAETERLRNALLSSVSHDLRTPLASITGSASSLLESGEHLDAVTRRELLQAIHEEADRLNRLVQDLLEMTRLESGAVIVRREWHPIEELVGAALGRLGKRLGARPVLTRIPADLPLVPLDGVLIEQLLINLIDNALKYTPETSPIEIAAFGDDDGVMVEVADRGPGLPPGDERRVFDKLYRGQAKAGRGSGLGLAICRGIVEAHGGRIWAENRSEGGVAFRFTLPVKETPPSIPPGDD
ncbi:MAG TPA: DUF4118 domain-containing protein [Methylomirabilota bacterium]|nr:DUF4118 domain-containing protein [Methylomirabilota bacterium]